MIEYQKIPGPFLRNTDGPDKNKLIPWSWATPELEATQGLQWVWTEKVDGTNIRVHWDGHKVTYGGRTENAQLPAKLLPVLDQLFPEELFEQKFQEQEVTLFGEGYGAGIQSGGIYRPDMSFVLFDVRVGQWWLRRDDMMDVAQALGVDVVPVIHVGTIGYAIELVRGGLQSTWNPSVRAEGLVGVTRVGLCGRHGERLIVKVKSKDFGSVAS